MIGDSVSTDPWLVGEQELSWNPQKIASKHVQERVEILGFPSCTCFLLDSNTIPAECSPTSSGSGKGAVWKCSISGLILIGLSIF